VILVPDDVAPGFAILDVETVLLDRVLPIDRIAEAVSSLNPYFDRVVRTGNAVLMRRGSDMALVGEDGTLRTISQRTSVPEAKAMYLKVLQVLQKILGFDTERVKLTVDINTICHRRGDRHAAEAMEDFLGHDKAKKVVETIGGQYRGLGISILASDFGREGSKERLEYEIEPLMRDPARYYIRTRYQHQEFVGTKFLDKVDEFAEKSAILVRMIEGR
jgi:hypothetical protein